MANNSPADLLGWAAAQTSNVHAGHRAIADGEDAVQGGGGGREGGEEVVQRGDVLGGEVGGQGAAH